MKETLNKPNAVNKLELSISEKIAKLQRLQAWISANAQTLKLLEEAGCSLDTSLAEDGINAFLLGQPGFTLTDNPLLFHLLEELEDSGFRVSFAFDSPENNYRAYHSQKDDLNLVLIVYLADESSACHRIIAGYEEVDVPVWQKVKRPVYKFQC